MSKYIISEQDRYYLDAILHTFCFPNKINDIRGQIESVVRLQKYDLSDDDIYRVSVSIKSFLSKYGFGHPEDHVFIIDYKGLMLKDSGSLAVFEESENR